MWGAIISGILGLGQMGYGAYQKGRAKKWAMNNPQPEYTIPSMYYSNLGLAEQQAQTGFSPETLNFLSQSAQQNQAQATNAILQAGGSVNNIAQIYAATNNRMRAIGLEDEKLKIAKINKLYDARKDLAGQQMTQWKLNIFDKWKNAAAANAVNMSNANSTMNSGLNTTLSAIGQGVNYASNQNRMPSSSIVETPNQTDVILSNNANQYESADWMQQTPQQIQQFNQNGQNGYNAPTSFNNLFLT